jgi:hypothetical protein
MRIRTIKPEFFTHEGIYSAEVESGLPLRIAFAGLWCAADREGRFKWEPRRLGVQILPYDLIDFSRVLDALVTRGFIVKYRVGNEDFALIPSFVKHQVINNREKASELPEPLKTNDSDACPTRDSRVPHACKAEGKGKEGNKEGKGEGKESRVDDASRSLAPSFSDSMPTETAKDFDALSKRINSLHPQWTKRPAMTYDEQQTMVTNSKALFALEAPDWALLKAYLASAIPESWGKFWQPDSRSIFLQKVSDVLNYADRWKGECKRRNVKTGIEEVAA